jgi:hypothetical protein
MTSFGQRLVPIPSRTRENLRSSGTVAVLTNRLPHVTGLPHWLMNDLSIFLPTLLANETNGDIEAARNAVFAWALEFARDYRGNRYPAHPCKSCDGLGARLYSSTATYHGGVGGQESTRGICNRCWGSGDEHAPWGDLRRRRTT